MDKDITLKGKLIIKGKIKTETGLHIGGTAETLKIGGSDNPVIRDKNGRVFIPGSSLKGKIRSLLEVSGYATVKYTANKPGKPCNCGHCDVCLIFGPHDSKAISEPPRIIVRDGYIVAENMSEIYEKLETKAENTIDRVKGTTTKGGIRNTERVVAGSEFDYEVIFNIYKSNDKELIKKFIEGMKLLEDDYLGGSGSRGYGKIKFKDLEVSYKPREYYEGCEDKIVEKPKTDDLNKLEKNIDDINF
jgi:CRISPR-associated protein Csm3